MRTWSDSWFYWALLSAIFAALTAIFAKIGVANINSDLATFLRTIIIAIVLAVILVVTRQFQPLASISMRTYAFLALSGLATGASWLCYFRALKIGDAARVAPIDKLSIVLVAVRSAVRQIRLCAGAGRAKPSFSNVLYFGTDRSWLR